MTYIQYDVVESKSREDLIARVNRSVAAGWQPMGGVQFDEPYYVQALALPEKSQVRPVRQEPRQVLMEKA